jgi:hypothetical protein
MMTRSAPPASATPATPQPTATSAITPIPAADPVAAVNALLDALTAKQFDKIPALMCADLRGSASSGTSQSADPQTAQFMDTLTIAFANRDVALKGKLVTGVPWRAISNGTLVDISGQLSITLPDATILALVAKEGNLPSSPDPSAVAQAVKGVNDMLNSISIAPMARVTNDGDGWLICSNVIVIAALASPSPAP